MANAGKRYPLLIYKHIVGRWWTVTLMIGIVMMVLWWYLPVIRPNANAFVDNLVWYVGIASFVFTGILVFMRNAAYVRPHEKYLLIATPFLRLKIGYKRIIQTKATEMSSLFSFGKLSDMQKESMAKLFKKTALVVELKSLPISRKMLNIFLSHYFFKDDTPHIVLLVDNWMGFSTELESLRTGGKIAGTKKKKQKESSIFDSLD